MNVLCKVGCPTFDLRTLSSNERPVHVKLLASVFFYGLCLSQLHICQWKLLPSPFPHIKVKKALTTVESFLQIGNIRHKNFLSTWLWKLLKWTVFYFSSNGKYHHFLNTVIRYSCQDCLTKVWKNILDFVCPFRSRQKRAHLKLCKVNMLSRRSNRR